MDERIDIVNSKGEPTGNTCMKSYAHQNGILHASVHIWFYTNKGDILIQKRAKNKDVFPNLWDVSVAGHIEAGEKIIRSAIREVQEEIGLSISMNQLIYKGICEEKYKHANGIIDHEIHHIYVAKLTTSIDEFTLQKEELSDVKLISIQELEDNYTNTHRFVPHTQMYYKHIIKLLRENIYNEK